MPPESQDIHKNLKINGTEIFKAYGIIFIVFFKLISMPSSDP